MFLSYLKLLPVINLFLIIFSGKKSQREQNSSFKLNSIDFKEKIYYLSFILIGIYRNLYRIQNRNESFILMMCSILEKVS
jgi:hypothetical protein